MSRWGTVQWQLPDWVEAWVDAWPEPFDEPNQRMRFAIGLALENVRQDTGGPFGAAVFAPAGQLLAPGVNLVTGIGCSAAHAEIVALSLAQANIGHYDLSQQGAVELVTSTEPCAMCLGAIPWSGVQRVISGATAADAEAAGFDEGCKPEPWTAALTTRGIEVCTGVERERSTNVFKAYLAGGGVIYNASHKPQ